MSDINTLYRINDLLTGEFPELNAEQVDELTHILDGHISAFLETVEEA